MEVTTGNLVPPAPNNNWPAVPRPRRRLMGRKTLVGLVILLLIVMGWLSLRAQPESLTISDSDKFSSGGEQSQVRGVDKSLFVRDSDHSLGSPTAPVQIIEFSDFECPYCLEAFPTIRALTVEYGERVHYVYRHFPITSIHAQAFAAAEASECARAQGQFWAYHDRLFLRPAERSDDDLRLHAQAVGLDLDKFDTCMSDHTYRGLVERDMEDGRRLGVVGTPTWFINGERVQGVIPADNFKAGIEKLLKQ
jgi:protein-disulfide isomerase